MADSVYNKLLKHINIVIPLSFQQGIEMRNMTAKKRMPPSLLLERIFAVMTVLGLTCLVVGFPLFMVGRISNEFTVARVGAYVLVFGVALVIMRILYWIAEEVVGRGLESMAKQKTFHMWFLQ